MKDTELFHTIRQLVLNRQQQQKPQKPSFGQQYCKQQIQKKKLLPFNPHRKMNHIMKNFEQLDTYVDVEELCKYVNLILKQKHAQLIESETGIKEKDNRNITIDNQETLRRIKQKLGPYYRKKYLQENQKAWKFLQTLQQSNYSGSSVKKNSSSNLDFPYFLNRVEQQKNLPQIDGNCSMFKSTEEMPNRQNKRKTSIAISKKKNPKSNLKTMLEKQQFIYRVSTYLHIILENIHKQKWNSNQNQLQKTGKLHKAKPKFNGRKEASSTFYNSSLNRSSILSNIDQMQKKHRMTANILTSSPLRNIKKGKTFHRHKSTGSVKRNFTFKNRNIKEGVMKKIDEFLGIVESQQKVFKKQKNDSIHEINKLEAKYKHNYHQFFRNALCMADQQAIKEIRQKAQAQK